MRSRAFSVAAIGVDPGTTGALALYRRNGTDVSLCVVDVEAFAYGAKNQKRIDPVAIRNQIDAWALAYHIDHAVVEEVHAMPKQGVSSTFNFGDTFGALRAVVALSGIPYTLVPPRRWQVSVRAPEGKDGSRMRAQQLFPKHRDLFRRGKDHNRAEAVLIAYYAAEFIA